MIKKIFKSIFYRIYNSGRNSDFENKKKSERYPGADVFGNIALLNVGECVSFGGNVMIFVNATVEIGKDSMIANGVKIITSTHDYNNNPTWKQRIDKPIKIGDNVWIGANAIILPGVKIGNHAVIGAGSVVTKHVAEKMIVAGNPAKFLKYRIVPDYDKSINYLQTEIITENYIADALRIQDNNLSLK